MPFDRSDIDALIAERRAELSSLLREERILSYHLTSAGRMSVTSIDGETVEADVAADVFDLIVVGEKF